MAPKIIQDTWPVVLANKSGETNLTTEIKARIRSDLESRYYEETTLFFHISNFVDPHYKLAKLSNTCITDQADCQGRGGAGW